MPDGYCVYGCTIVLPRFDKPNFGYPRNIKNCKICDKEFIPVSSSHKYCGTKCRKKAAAEQARVRPKHKRPRFAKHIVKVGDLTPEEILINKEIEERESRFSRCLKVECANCRYLFRTFDKEKKFCTLECEKKYAYNARVREYEAKKRAEPEKKCKDCKKKYKTLKEDIGLCIDCRNYHSKIQKATERLEIEREKFLKGKNYHYTSKQKQAINDKLNWAATEVSDPITKRLKVMRG